MGDEAGMNPYRDTEAEADRVAWSTRGFAAALGC